MLTLGIKPGEKINLYTPLKKAVEEACGLQIASQIDAPLKNFQQTRDDLLQVSSFRNDSTALEKLASAAKMYLSMWSCISQSFSFGPGKVIFPSILD